MVSSMIVLEICLFSLYRTKKLAVQTRSAMEQDDRNKMMLERPLTVHALVTYSKRLRIIPHISQGRLRFPVRNDDDSIR